MDQNFLLRKMFEILEKFKIPLVLGLSGLLLVGVGLLWPNLKDPKKEIVLESKSETSSQTTVKLIKVDVAGAVTNPGVYQLKSESRVEDAVSLAGGFSAKADLTWVAKNLNLASKISDGQKIYIQSVGENPSGSSILGTKTVSDKVNINFATASELDTLPSIGAVTAEKIISLRPYNSVSELLSKKAVGKSTYEKIKDLVSVN